MTAVAQSGICAEARPYASFIVFDWCDGVDVPAARRALAQVPLPTQALAAEYPQVGLCSVVAIGAAARGSNCTGVNRRSCKGFRNSAIP